MKLVVRVDPRRDREGALSLVNKAGKVLFGPVPVCATADAANAARQNNAACDPLRPGGHPPFGTYRLARVESLDASERGERGPLALSFEPVAGDALRAEGFGRLLLDLHGGERASDGGLKPTSGGLRVENGVLEALAARLAGEKGTELELVGVKESWWSRLFRRRVRSGEEPAERDTTWSSSDSGRSEPVFSGRGGEFSGAGASGSWGAASASRTAASVGAAAATGAAVAAAAAASESETSGEGAGTESAAAESGAGTTTETSY